MQSANIVVIRWNKKIVSDSQLAIQKFFLVIDYLPCNNQDIGTLTPPSHDFFFKILKIWILRIKHLMLFYLFLKI